MALCADSIQSLTIYSALSCKQSPQIMISLLVDIKEILRRIQNGEELHDRVLNAHVFQCLWRIVQKMNFRSGECGKFISICQEILGLTMLIVQTIAIEMDSEREFLEHLRKFTMEMLDLGHNAKKIEFMAVLGVISAVKKFVHLICGSCCLLAVVEFMGKTKSLRNRNSVLSEIATLISENLKQIKDEKSLFDLKYEYFIACYKQLQCICPVLARQVSFKLSAVQKEDMDRYLKNYCFAKSSNDRNAFQIQRILNVDGKFAQPSLEYKVEFLIDPDNLDLFMNSLSRRYSNQDVYRQKMRCEAIIENSRLNDEILNRRFRESFNCVQNLIILSTLKSGFVKWNRKFQNALSQNADMVVKSHLLSAFKNTSDSNLFHICLVFYSFLDQEWFKIYFKRLLETEAGFEFIFFIFRNLHESPVYDLAKLIAHSFIEEFAKHNLLRRLIECTLEEEGLETKSVWQFIHDVFSEFRLKAATLSPLQQLPFIKFVFSEHGFIIEKLLELRILKVLDAYFAFHKSISDTSSEIVDFNQDHIEQLSAIIYSYTDLSKLDQASLLKIIVSLLQTQNTFSEYLMREFKYRDGNFLDLFHELLFQNTECSCILIPCLEILRLLFLNSESKYHSKEFTSKFCLSSVNAKAIEGSTLDAVLKTFSKEIEKFESSKLN
jgi:hypothetical protein